MTTTNVETIRHSALPPAAIHAPHAWRVASEAERQALEVTDQDIGKYALQGTGAVSTEWLLVGVAPAVWAQRGAKGDPGTPGSKGDKGENADRFNRLNLLKWRSALAQMRAGTRNARIGVFGDSTGRGASYGGGAEQVPSSWPMRLAEILSKRGIPASAHSFWGSGGFSPFTSADARFAGTSGWTEVGGASTLGGRFMFATSAGTLKFTPTGPVDTFDLYWVRSPAARSGTVNVNGGATLATIGAAGTSAVQKTTVTAALGINTLNVVWASGTLQVIACAAYDSTQKQILVHNCSVAGGHAYHFTPAVNPHDALRVAKEWVVPDLAIIDLLINGWRTADGIASVVSDYTTITNGLRAAGADVIFHMPIPDNSSLGDAPIQPQYSDAIKALAVTLGVEVFDCRAAWPTFAMMNDLGFYSDDVHPKPVGYWDLAEDIAVRVFL